MLARPRPNGHPKMLPAQPGINAPRSEWIDINAIDGTDPVHFTHPRAGEGRRTRAALRLGVGPQLTDDQFDDNQFSIENGDGEIY